MTIAFITFNRSFELRRAIDSIISQMVEGDEIVIADNGSRDEHRNAMTEYATQLSAQGVRIRLQLLDRNYGVAGGRNIVWKMANYQYVLFLDDDCVIEDARFLEKIRSYLALNSGIGALAIHIEERESRAQHFSDNIVTDENGHLLIDKYHGGAHIINKDVCVWDSLYPDSLFWGAEENYVSIRIWGSGREIHLLPDAKVYHCPETTVEGRIVTANSRMENALANLFIIKRLLYPIVLYPILDIFFAARLLRNKFRMKISIRTVLNFVWQRYDTRYRNRLTVTGVMKIYKLFGWQVGL